MNNVICPNPSNCRSLARSGAGNLDSSGISTASKKFRNLCRTKPTKLILQDKCCCLHLQQLYPIKTIVMYAYRRLACRQRKAITAFGSQKPSLLIRGLASHFPQTDDKKQESSLGAKKEAEQLLEHSARGIGQVIFLNSPMSGAVILGGLAVSNPYLASLGALGAVTATATAKGAGLDNQALKDGLWAYNGCLIGCAAAVFGPSSLLACTSSTILGAASTPFVSATLNETMKIPQWTYSFNLVALTSLLRTRPLLPAEDIVADIAPVANSPGFGNLLVSPFTGISQIFVVESALSGSIIFYGIGMVSLWYFWVFYIKPSLLTLCLTLSPVLPWTCWSCVDGKCSGNLIRGIYGSRRLGVGDGLVGI